MRLHSLSPRFFRACIIVLPILAGCAIGNKHNYRDVVASVPSMEGESVVVATHDRRPYIVSGTKPIDFVGLQRSGYGQPFDVSTKGDSFSNSFSAAACGSLRKAGARCDTVETMPSEDSASVTQKVSQRRAPHGLIFTVNEWKSDGMVRASVRYDVILSVVDASGGVLATKQIQGNDITSDSIWVLSPPRAARQGSLAALKAKLEELLGSASIVAALNIKNSVNSGTAAYVQNHSSTNVSADPVPQPTESEVSKSSPGTCSVDQILGMKKIGLTDQQIQRSCR